MDMLERQQPGRPLVLGERAEGIGGAVLRYGLVFFLVTGGLAKFTTSEAWFIQPFLAHSPLFGWWYGLVGIQPASDLIGVVEICLGVLLALHHWRPRLAAIGSMGAAAEFVVTLSFLFTTPGLSTAMSGFLLKDLMLLGAAIWSMGESLRRHASSPGKAVTPEPDD
jgi:reactive chlorine resistance protein C